MSSQHKERQETQDEQLELDPKNMKLFGTVTPPDYVPEDPDEAEALRVQMLSLQHLSINITE